MYICMSLVMLHFCIIYNIYFSYRKTVLLLYSYNEYYSVRNRNEVLVRL